MHTPPWLSLHCKDILLSMHRLEKCIQVQSACGIFNYFIFKFNLLDSMPSRRVRPHKSLRSLGCEME